MQVVECVPPDTGDLVRIQQSGKKMKESQVTCCSEPFVIFRHPSALKQCARTRTDLVKKAQEPEDMHCHTGQVFEHFEMNSKT